MLQTVKNHNTHLNKRDGNVKPAGKVLTEDLK